MPFIPDPLSPWDVKYANSLGQKIAAPLDRIPGQPASPDITRTSVNENENGELVFQNKTTPGSAAIPDRLKMTGKCDTCGTSVGTARAVQHHQEMGKQYDEFGKLKTNLMSSGFVKHPDTGRWTRIENAGVDKLPLDVPVACRPCAEKHILSERVASLSKTASAEDSICRVARGIINSRMALNEQLFADNADHDNVMQVIKATNRHMIKHHSSCTECKTLRGEGTSMRTNAGACLNCGKDTGHPEANVCSRECQDKIING